MFSNMLNQKKFVSRKQNFRRTIPLKHLLDMRKSIICSVVLFKIKVLVELRSVAVKIQNSENSNIVINANDLIQDSAIIRQKLVCKRIQ